MAKIKLNFRNLTVPEKIVRAQQVVAAMRGNTRFPHPIPDLADLSTAVDELEAAANAAQAARLEAKARTAAQTQREEDLNRLMSQLVAHVESVAGDDEALILSAGLEPRGAGAPAFGEPEAPTSLTATTGDFDGEIELSWDAVRGARSYVVERSPAPPAESTWTHAAVSTRSSTTVKGLTTGTRYWFRVAAVTAAGQSPWSNPAMRVAP